MWSCRVFDHPEGSLECLFLNNLGDLNLLEGTITNPFGGCIVVWLPIGKRSEFSSGLRLFKDNSMQTKKLFKITTVFARFILYHMKVMGRVLQNKIKNMNCILPANWLLVLLAYIASAVVRNPQILWYN